MPKLMCSCGSALSYGSVPCEIEYLFISDVKYDKYSGQIDSEELYEEMSRFIRCPNCETLWMFWAGSDSPVEYRAQSKND